MSKRKTRGATLKNKTDSRAKVRKTAPRNAVVIWATMHQIAIKNAMSRFTRMPVASLLTTLVVGIALFLPAAFQVLLVNLEQGQSSIDRQARISLFLTSANSDAINLLINELKSNTQISSVTHISPDEGLQQFQQDTGLQNLSTLLDRNPLPAVITVEINPSLNSTDKIEMLRNQLQTHALVDAARLDVTWLEQIFNVSQFIKKIAAVITLFLIFSVLIVIGNTIKLLAEGYHEEIAVSKLFGATNAYVRRPFLYSGFFHGFFGSIIALILLAISLLWVAPQLEHLGQIYQSQISLIGLSFLDIMTLILTGILLGLGGAWIAANQIITKLNI